MTLDQDTCLPAAFRKLQKIGKGLKSNGTSNKARFVSRNPFTELVKDLKDCVCMSVSLFTFYIRKWTFTRWFSFSIFRHSRPVGWEDSGGSDEPPPPPPLPAAWKGPLGGLLINNLTGLKHVSHIEKKY